MPPQRHHMHATRSKSYKASRLSLGDLKLGTLFHLLQMVFKANEVVENIKENPSILCPVQSTCLPI